MAKTMTTEFDWYKNKNMSVKLRGSAALAASYIKPVQISAFSKTRYVWPSSLNNDSRYMTRKVFGKEMPNV